MKMQGVMRAILRRGESRSGIPLRSILFRLSTAIILAVAAYAVVLRPWHVHWGATVAEMRMAMPGDEIVAKPNIESTRAVTIDATPERVWPWLVQIGQGRGGLYSYPWIEKLFGANLPDAKHIVPLFQRIAVGDIIRMGPEGYPFFVVENVQPNTALVLRAHDARTSQPVSGSWTFIIIDQGDGTARLVSRQRLAYQPNLVNFLVWRVATEPTNFVVEQKMLRTIKALVEGGAAQP